MELVPGQASFDEVDKLRSCKLVPSDFPTLAQESVALNQDEDHDSDRKFGQSLLLNYPSIASELDAEHVIAQAIILVMHDPNAIKATILLVEKITDRSFTVVCG